MFDFFWGSCAFGSAKGKIWSLINIKKRCAWAWKLISWGEWVRVKMNSSKEKMGENKQKYQYHLEKLMHLIFVIAFIFQRFFFARGQGSWEVSSRKVAKTNGLEVILSPKFYQFCGGDSILRDCFTPVLWMCLSGYIFFGS